ncbi:MAG: ABC transporter ATP-binding protein [Chthonomonas sp.]|nr:ABC transporter ATP-binding protein [Chthonomonas sp.]
MQPLLRTENLGKRFGDRWIFRNLNMELVAGQILVVRGYNGSGKSTLLRCLSGLLPASAGSVTRESLGYYGLDLALYPDLTPAEHADLIGMTSLDLFERVGLKQALHQKVKEFSTGMRGRAKLALSLADSPTIWLLDEPTAALDEHGQAALAQLVQEQATRGAVILATNAEVDANWGTHELVLD